MQIEQALYTSVQTDRGQGYQLVGSSPGLDELDARELAVWGPSHDSLLDSRPTAASTNFHRLASGAYCISRTTIAGPEYSGRGHAKVCTQFLVVPPVTLDRFRNNPFALLRAAMSHEEFRAAEHLPKVLAPLRLVGGTAVSDLSLLARLARDPGPGPIAAMIEAALTHDRVAISSNVSTEQLFAGLFSLLPVECRVEFTFSTGLKPSAGRVVRLSALPREQSSWRGIERQGIALVLLDDLSIRHADGWAGYIGQMMAAGHLSSIAAALSIPRPRLKCADLDTLCQTLPAIAAHDVPSVASADAENTEMDAIKPPSVITAPAIQRADEAHSPEARLAAVVKDHVPKGTIDDLSELLSAQPAEVVELLERIDDLVFNAIRGDQRSLSELEVLWPVVVGELNDDLVEQSREQYLRCMLSIWSDCSDGESKQPDRAVAAIDVLCVLFEE